VCSSDLVSGQEKSYNYTRITSDNHNHPKPNYESTNKFKSHRNDFDKPTREFKEDKNSQERDFKSGQDGKKDFKFREKSNSYKSKTR
jgi:hypothetical protein